MADAKPRPSPRILTVTGAGHITPNMIRVTLTAPFVRELPAGIEGAHCKLYLPEPGESASTFEMRLQLGPRPEVRTYTIRHIRPEASEIEIDFVDHGDVGPASAWARAAVSGSVCGFGGPGPVKLKSFYADTYLVAADMSALPVAAATLEAMPRDAKGLAIFEITHPDDAQAIDAPSGVALRWLTHPHPHISSQQAVDIIRDLPPFDGSVQTCIAGESTVIQALRAHLMNERRLAKVDTYISGYWKIGLIEDEHQKFKRETAA
ncbi:MAG: siderophore-interacting protein [Pseudomonadota bacterium]